MPQKVYCNIEKHRILDNKREIEDVTKFGLPTIQHPTTTVKTRWISPSTTITA